MIGNTLPARERRLGARRPAGYLSWALPSRTLDAGEQIAPPRAFAGTVTTRLAINELRSARRPGALGRRVAARTDHHRRL